MRLSNAVSRPLARLFSYHKRYLVLAILTVTVTVTAVAFVSNKLKTNATVKKDANQTVQGKAKQRASAAREYVRPGLLQPMLRESLRQHGDRFEKPGKERTVLTGTLNRTVNGETAVRQVRLDSEFPHKFRLEEQGGNRRDLFGFDGQAGWKRSAVINRQDQDLIESLVFDTPGHFFLEQTNGASTRLMGTGFRLDDGKTENYSGPYYTVYQFSDQNSKDPSVHAPSKFYFFNTSSLLLEQVRYDLTRDGGKVSVEVHLSDWQQVGDQRIPCSITRLENGTPVFELTVRPVSISSRIADGSFDANAIRNR